ncbi:MAG: hypothetical protein IKM51_05530, partial [Oscillospiraceae bacterium]|nr:hypothetical protein [Oscillospiraceae bacterium]
IAVDEITAAEDTEAIMQAHGWGVKLIATAHAENFEDLAANKLYSKLLERGVFERVVTVRAQNGVRKYEVTKLDKTAWRNNLGGRNDLGGPWSCPEP